MSWSPDLDPTTAPAEALMTAPAPKPHWTQRPENRAKVRRNLKLMRAGRKQPKQKSPKRTRHPAPRPRAPKPNGKQPAPKLGEHTSYLYGKVENILEHYARSNELPFAALARGVADLLHRSTGAVLGAR